MKQTQKSSKLKEFLLRLVIGFFAVVVIFFLLTSFNEYNSISFNEPNKVVPQNFTEQNNFANITVEEGSKSGWNKYTNIAQGYSIELPSTYKYDNLSMDTIQFSEQETNTGMGQEPSKYTRRITIYGPQDAKVAGEIESLRSYIKNGQAQDSGIQAVIWSKINGYDVAIEGNEEYYGRYYFFNNGHIYVIDKNTFDLEFNQIFKQIISTFKFI